MQFFKGPGLIVGADLFGAVQSAGYNVIRLTAAETGDRLTQLRAVAPRKILLSDLAQVPQATKQILKFLEEYTGDAVVHASEDCLDAVAMSRFLWVRKRVDLPEQDRREVEPEKIVLRWSRLPRRIKTHLGRGCAWGNT